MKKSLRRDMAAVSAIEAECYPVSVLEDAIPAADNVLYDGHSYRLVRCNGAPAGYVTLEWLSRGRAYVSDLAVLPQYRHRPSVWKELLTWLNAQLASANEVSADCRSTSASVTIRLLERAGMKVTTTTFENWFEGEMVTNVVGRR